MQPLSDGLSDMVAELWDHAVGKGSELGFARRLDSGAFKSNVHRVRVAAFVVEHLEHLRLHQILSADSSWIDCVGVCTSPSDHRVFVSELILGV